jgi:hypothetical protein
MVRLGLIGCDMICDKVRQWMERLECYVTPTNYLTMKDRIPNNTDAWSLALKRLGPAGKLRAAQRLYFSARRIKEASIRAKHHTWDDSQVKQALNEAFWNARD